MPSIPRWALPASSVNFTTFEVIILLKPQHCINFFAKLYMKRSTLSDAMKNRPYQIYEGLFYKLLGKCRLHAPKHHFDFPNPLYSMDASVINLALSMFPRANYRQRKGAIKLHYQYDLDRDQDVD